MSSSIVLTADALANLLKTGALAQIMAIPNMKLQIVSDKDSEAVKAPEVPVDVIEPPGGAKVEEASPPPYVDSMELSRQESHSSNYSSGSSESSCSSDIVDQFEGIPRSAWFAEKPKPVSFQPQAAKYQPVERDVAVKQEKSSNSAFKLQLCQRWKAGFCSNGKNCNYAHGVQELPASYKSALCYHWESAGKCPHGHKCAWAHGAKELRAPRGYKTTMCRAYQTNQCKHGAACHYAHSKAELRQ